MIFAPPQPSSPAAYPSYVEIGDEDTFARYRNYAKDIRESYERSAFLRRTLALQEARIQLERLRSLNVNWNSFGSDVPANSAIEAAGRVLESLLRADLVPDGILPSAEGGVAICFVKDDKYADIECLNSGEVLGVKSTLRQRPFVWTLDEASVDSDSAAQDISLYLAY